MPKYYSKRNKSLSKQISYDFRKGLCAYIKEISERGWLSEHFGHSDEFGQRWGLVNEKINNKMLQEIGDGRDMGYEGRSGGACLMIFGKGKDEIGDGFILVNHHHTSGEIF